MENKICNSCKMNYNQVSWLICNDVCDECFYEEETINGNLQIMRTDNKAVENHYQHYLKLMKLKESEMPAIQKQETRRAFYGGYGEAMVAVKHKYDFIHTSPFATSLINEVNEFFKEEVIKIDFNKQKQHENDSK